MMMFHPDLLSKNSDPEGSVRYSNVNICHEKIECKHEDTTFSDDIAKTNTFIIDDRSPKKVLFVNRTGIFVEYQLRRV